MLRHCDLALARGGEDAGGLVCDAMVYLGHQGLRCYGYFLSWPESHHFQSHDEASNAQ